jgi:hypothetical protein
MKDTHHLFWPRRAYQTPLERQFRNLHINRVTIDIDSHNLIHRFTNPPEKPGIDFMAYMVAKYSHRDRRPR